MTESPRRFSIYALSIGFAIVPIAFALIRALKTGSDTRYFWMALATFLGATAVMAIGRASGRAPSAVVWLATAAFIAATLLGKVAASLLGATASSGMWIVSASMALCWTASRALAALSRAPAS